MNVSGHRIGTAEVESALVLHEQVAEAAVVGFPHAIKGEGIYAFVTLMQGADEDHAAIKESLIDLVRREIAPSPSRTPFSGRPACPRLGPARSCAASCARSPPRTSTTSAT